MSTPTSFTFKMVVVACCNVAISTFTVYYFSLGKMTTQPSSPLWSRSPKTST